MSFASAITRVGVTASAAGFHMPAEWAPHTRCWMAWPAQGMWDELLMDARRAYSSVAKAISRFEPVYMLARPDDAEGARAALGDSATVLEAPLDEAWLRDSGPTFVIDNKGAIAGVDWVFNGWGGRTPTESDAHLASFVLQRAGTPRFASPLVCEGGAIHTDGEGTLMVVETTIPNSNRNPALSREEVERELCAQTGTSKVVWLGRGLDGDYGPVGTDGHVDTVACFARPGVVIAQVATDPDDSDYATLRANVEVLKASTDAKGRLLDVVEIAQPARRDDDAHGGRLPMSYVNFYLCGTRAGAKGLVLPVYDDPADAAAVKVLQDLFPDREIVTVDGVALFRGGGGVHCITQQEPDPSTA